jgi:cytochrome c oxidase subunit 3
MVATVEHHSHDPVPSRWPIIAALGVGLVPVGLVANAHGWKGGLALIGVGLLIALNGAGRWWGELLRDKFFGRDAAEADSRLKRMFAFFIASEAMIFGAFFAALFYARHHAKIWPPEGMPHFEILLPAVNTVILLSSSVTLHLGHVALERGRKDGMIAALLMTIFLGALFLCGQAYEYGFLNGSAFNVKSGIFGTTFFMLTGFHGLHVLVGIIFLNVVYGAAIRNVMTPSSISHSWQLPGTGTSSTSCGYAFSPSSTCSSSSRRGSRLARLLPDAGGTKGSPEEFQALKESPGREQGRLSRALAAGEIDRVSGYLQGLSTCFNDIWAKSSAMNLLDREHLAIQLASGRKMITSINQWVSSSDIDAVRSEVEKLNPVLDDVDTLLDHTIRATGVDTQDGS